MLSLCLLTSSASLVGLGRIYAFERWSSWSLGLGQHPYSLPIDNPSVRARHGRGHHLFFRTHGQLSATRCGHRAIRADASTLRLTKPDEII